MIDLNAIIIAEASGDIDHALDVVFNQVQDNLIQGSYLEVDNFLAELRVEQHCDDILLGFLTSTYPARSKLPYRNILFARCVTIMASRNDPLELRELLRGLDTNIRRFHVLQSMKGQK